MEGLRGAPMDREQLAARIGFDGSAFDRSMRRLTRMGLVVAMVVPDDRRRREYQMACCGRDLLAIDAELERAMAGIAVQGDDLKTLAAKAISDPWGRAVTRAVLEAPQPFGELLRTARGITERRRSRLNAAALTTRLARLRRLGLIDHQPAPPQGAALYQPGKDIWRLGQVAALSALWRWNWTPDCVPRMAGDLSGLVRMLAPRVRATEAPQIRVVLHVIAPPMMDPWPDVVVCLTDGRMSLPELTLIEPDARARATPRVWLESLLSGELDAITVEGEATAAHAVIAGLAAVMRL
jgi:DNA-binding HxlR family transcriptional regulator